MAGNYSQLKSDLQAVVKENHEEYITGQRLQNQLIAMINSLGTGYQYMGVATITTNPGTPDQKVFYIAPPGEYSNFGTGITVNDGEVAILKWDTAWHKEVTGAATAAQVTELGQEVVPFIGGDVSSIMQLEQGAIILSSGVDIISSKTIRTANYIQADSILIETSGNGVGVIGYTEDGSYAGSSEVFITSSQEFSLPGAYKYRVEFRRSDNIDITPSDFDSLGISIKSKFERKVVLEEEMDEIIGEPEVIFSSEQDIVGCVAGNTFTGQAVFFQGAIGLEFDTLDIPFSAPGKDVTLKIGETNTADDMADALSAGLLITKTIHLDSGISYKTFKLGETVKISKYYCAIAVISNSADVTTVYHADTTGLVSINRFLLTGVWYKYGGGAASVGYGAFPILRSSGGTLEKRVQALEERAEQDNIQVSLPKIIKAVVGDVLQVFFPSVIRMQNPYTKNILVACEKGNQYPRFFQYSPAAADVGNYPFAIKVRNDDGVLLGEKIVALNVVGAGSSPANRKNIVCLGDSLTAGGQWVEEASRRLTRSGGSPIGRGLSNLNFCGSMGSGNAKFFAVGGWTWSNYTGNGGAAFRFYVSGVSALSFGATYTNNGSSFRIIEINITEGGGNILCQRFSGTNNPTASGTLSKTSGDGDDTIIYSQTEQAPANPFWDNEQNKITFIPYANTYCDGQIDAIYIALGSNGLTPFKTDFSATLGQVKTFADTLHLEFPNAKLKLIGCAGISRNGGIGANYGATGTGYADGYGILMAMLNLNEAYQEFADSDEYSSFVEYIDIISQVDNEYNFPQSEFNVNMRNTRKEYRGTNGIHPETSGYYQIADVIYRSIIADFCQ